MPYARPTLTQLNGQAIQDITTSGVPGLDGLLRNAVLRVLAWVMSGLAYAVYGFVDWVSKQAVPFTSTDEYLFGWGELKGVYLKDATGSHGMAQFTGNPGLTLPAGSSLTLQNGTEYVTTADGTIDPILLYMQVPFEAVDVGAYTNADPLTPINISQPPTGINAAGFCVGPVTGGADQETQDEYRTRMLQRYAQPPQGGSNTDYVTWALAVPGVTRAWCNPNGAGVGTVVVYTMFDDANAADGGFPQGTNGVATDEDRDAPATGDQLTVADAIYPQQPVTALVYSCAPEPLPIDVQLEDLEPNTGDMLEQIQAALDDAFLAFAEVAGTIYPNQIYEAVQATPGVTHFVVASPAAPVVAATGQLPVMGSLSST